MTTHLMREYQTNAIPTARNYPRDKQYKAGNGILMVVRSGYAMLIYNYSSSLQKQQVFKICLHSTMLSFKDSEIPSVRHTTSKTQIVYILNFTYWFSLFLSKPKTMLYSLDSYFIHFYFSYLQHIASVILMRIEMKEKPLMYFLKNLSFHTFLLHYPTWSVGRIPNGNKEQNSTIQLLDSFRKPLTFAHVVKVFGKQ